VSEPTKRLTLTDAYRDAQHVIDQLTTRAPSETSATVEIDTTAKGEPKPRVHLHAPMDADLDALQAHANALAAIALTAYFNATPANGVPVDAEESVPF
jgi:hypothetical protein